MPSRWKSERELARIESRIDRAANRANAGFAALLREIEALRPPAAIEARWRALRGYLLYRVDRDDEALEELERAANGADADAALRAQLWRVEWLTFHERLDEADAFVRTLVKVVRRRGKPRDRGELLLVRARLADARRAREAATLYGRAADALAKAGASARAYLALEKKAGVLAGHGRLHQARAALETATLYLRVTPARQREALTTLALRAAATPAAERAVQLLIREFARPPLPFGKLLNVCRRLLALGKFGEAAHLADHLRRVAASRAQRAWATLAWSTARLDVQGLDSVEEALRTTLIEPRVPSHLKSRIALNLAGVLLAMDRSDSAWSVLPLVEIRHLEGDSEALGVLALNRGLLLLQRGVYEAALDDLGRGIDLLEGLPSVSALVVGLAIGASVLLDCGQLDSAHELLAQAEGLSARTSAQQQARIVWVRGLWHALSGQATKADRAYEASIALYQAIGDRQQASMVLTDRAALAMRRGARVSARRLVDAALASSSPGRSRAWAYDACALVAKSRREAIRFHRLAAREHRRWGDLVHEADALDSAARAETGAAALRLATHAFRLALSLADVLDNEEHRLDALSRTRYIGTHVLALLLRARRNRAALATALQLKSGELLRSPEPHQPVVAPGVGARPRDPAERPPSARTAGFRRSNALDEESVRRVRETYARLTRARGAASAIDSRAILRRLEPDQAALEIFLPAPDMPEIVIFVLRHGRVHALRRPWRLEHESACRVAGDLVSGHGASGVIGAALLEDALRTLHEALIAPIAHQLRGARRLVVAPGTVLGHLPFEALLDKRHAALGECLDVSYLLSTMGLIHSRGHNPRGGYCVQDGSQARRWSWQAGQAPTVHG